jgi:hypothetical protein
MAKAKHPPGDPMTLDNMHRDDSEKKMREPNPSEWVA